MADNVSTPVASGVNFAADEISGVLYPRTKLSHGVDGSATDVSSASPLPVEIVVRSTPTSRSMTAGTSAAQLMPSNANRRGFSVQNQSESATVYVNAISTAAADSSSLKIGPGDYFEWPLNHSGTSAVSIISTEASTPVYAREW